MPAETTIFCFVCGAPTDTAMCWQCKRRLAPFDKLLMVLIPHQDEDWQPYFATLDNAELEELIRQSQLERARRLSEYFGSPEWVAKQEALYGGADKIPSHHRKSDVTT